jgi:uncharacterized protein YjbI with pentapeptide repeats
MKSMVHLNFAGQNLSKRSFRGQNLSGVSFAGSNLQQADFREAILQGTDFSQAQVQGTNFQAAQMQGANFKRAKAGIPRFYRMLLQTLLCLAAMVAGSVAGYIGSWTNNLLLSKAMTFEKYELVKFILPWSTVSGILIVVSFLTYSFTLLRKNPSVAIINGTSLLFILGLLTFWLIAVICNQVGRPGTFGELSATIFSILGAAIIEMAMIVGLLSIIFCISQQNTLNVLTTMLGMLVPIFTGRLAIGSWVLSGGVICNTALAIYLGFYISKRALAEDKNYYLFRDLAIRINSFWGTQFERSDLTGANFGAADLFNSNFWQAQVAHTNFSQVQGLASVRVGRTFLTDRRVRDLLVNLCGEGESLEGCNLQDAYLVGADLRETNLVSADLRGAILNYAQLDGANLSRAVVVGTSFWRSSMTGACLEDWAIDHTTQLDGVVCDYVYLADSQQQRTPASGVFAPGDFTKLFREFCDTVDLIFRHGVDWAAFSNTLQQLQTENPELAVRSVEKRGEGLVVVKVDVPPEIEPAILHEEFTQVYDLAVQAIAERYQAELQSRDRQLEIYRQQQEQVYSLLENFTQRSTAVPNNSQLVLLKFNSANTPNSFLVTAQIGKESTLPQTELVVELNDVTEVLWAYKQWQEAYRQYYTGPLRIDVPENQVTNIRGGMSRSDCEHMAQNLGQQMNYWLAGEGFRSVREQLLQSLQAQAPIRIIVQTDDPQMRRLPWQLWDLLERFPLAEMGVSGSSYHGVEFVKADRQMRILAIFGNSVGIDIGIDRQLLRDLPQAEVECLVEPSRQLLNDRLWAKPWDIIFFAGHSASAVDGSTGYLRINESEYLMVPEIKHGLRRAVDRGLQLVILNSCDGLGLATDLADLNLPQMIVMREPVPDLVAQEFLRGFLLAFARGIPLYEAVRKARERLYDLEDRFPCASWLPVICQNPGVIPFRWSQVGSIEGDE